jgi:NAD(P)-dependent dehydrogenase (short-subunit alcohol dehydrogenase family)
VFHLTKFLRPQLESRQRTTIQRVINIEFDRRHPGAMLETYAYSSARPPCTSSPGTSRRALAPKVTVSAIAPGPFQSRDDEGDARGFGESIAASAPDEAHRGRPGDMVPDRDLPRVPRLCHVTGAVIPVDGGIATVA